MLRKYSRISQLYCLLYMGNFFLYVLSYDLRRFVVNNSLNFCMIILHCVSSVALLDILF